MRKLALLFCLCCFTIIAVSQEHIQKSEELTTYRGFFGVVFKIDGKKLSHNKIKELYANHPKAMEAYNSGKSLSTFGTFFSCVGAAFICWEVGNLVWLKGDYKVNNTTFYSGCGCLFVGIMFDIMGNSKFKQSVSIYNSSKRNDISLNLHFGFTRDGIGVCMKF